RVQFSNRGAQATSWILKGPQFTDSDSKPLDLVHHQAAEQFGYPLSIYSSDALVANKLNQALFVPSQTGHADAPATVTFKYSDGATVDGPFDWVGISDRYFAAVFLPDSPAQANIITFNRQLDVAKTITRVGFGSNSPAKGSMNVPVLGAALGNPSGPTQTRIF